MSSDSSEKPDSASHAMRPEACGDSVEGAVIAREPLEYVSDHIAGWHDARTTDVLVPRDSRPMAGICVVESDTPVEIKGCIPEQGNGSSTTPGRWFIRKASHDKLLDARGAYYFCVYAPSPSTPLLAALIAPAAIVDDLLADSWYDPNRRGGGAGGQTDLDETHRPEEDR